MPVNLSPVGGAAVQFFTSSGVPLAGGKLYSYAAGTTTPQATYTSSGGGTASANPIVLDSAGRVSGSGEVWLTGNLEYKFILKDSTDVLIGTYDNIRGIGDTTVLLAFEALLAGSTGSSLVGYTQGGTGAATTTVQAKLRQMVSVLDFGADSTGVADSTTAFTNALGVGKNVYAPAGTYRLNALPLLSNSAIFGDGMRRTIFIPTAAATSVLLVDATSVPKQNVTLQDLCVKNPNNVTGCYGIWFKGTDVSTINDQHNLTNIEIGPVGWEATSYKFAKGIYATGRLITPTLINVINSSNTINWHSATDTATPAFNGAIFMQCVFQLAEAQGFLHTGQSTNVKFIGGYTQQNNSLNVAGVAGMQVSDTFNWDIDNHGFEANGSGVAVSTTLPLTNSISFRHSGTICQELSIHGGYFTSSGTNIVIDSTVTSVVGGRINNNFLNCLTGGFNFATLSAGGSNSALNPIAFSSSNYVSGQISIYTAGVGINAIAEQGSGVGYLTATVSDIDLLKTSNFTCNPSTAPTITGVTITGTGGQFQCTATTLSTGTAVTISGTYGGTGSITGYVNPTTYYIIATNGTTTFTLSATYGGSAITTTAGTPTGLTYTALALIIPVIANMIPGCKLTILNSIYGASTVTIAAGLMVSGVASSVTTGTVGIFQVQGAPAPGKFVRLQ